MINEFIELKAEKRVLLGTSASKKIRRISKKIPGVICINNKCSIHINIDYGVFENMVKKSNIYFCVINMKLDDVIYSVVLEKIQYHPCNSYMLHLDFKKVCMSDFIIKNVPINYINLDKSLALKSGAIMYKSIVSVNLFCKVSKLISCLDIDISCFSVGDSFYIKDLVLPDGCSLNNNFYNNKKNNTLIFRFSLPKKVLDNKDVSNIV